MRKAWLLVYALILGIIICTFLIVNGVERRRAQETIAPTTPRTTLIPPETTTPEPTR
jgi:hypothetical protein